jgi:predicted nucleic acid-binding Zn ribbon protein
MDETVAQERTTTEQCVRCLEPVPLNALRCPHCGEPVSHRRRTVFKVIAVAGILAMAFMLVLMYRTVYISESQPVALPEDDEVARRDPFAEQARSPEQGGTKADEKPPSPPEPEKPPPLNR